MPPQEHAYTAEERRSLLELARRAMTAALRGEQLETSPADGRAHLEERTGCFVTLRSRAGRLRGCIGTFDRSSTLRETIVAMASAATRDSRFSRDPVTPEEVDDLRISVRVLTPLEPLVDPLDVDIGKEGLYIIGCRDEEPLRGCFLPEVAPEQGWDAEQLVSHCCADKMNLPRDAWKPPTDLEFFTFRAIGVSEA